MRSLSAFFKSKPLPAETLAEAQFISLIHSSQTTRQLKLIHARIFRHGLFHSSRVITQLIAACSPLRSADYALSAFNYFPSPNAYLFNALIRALFENYLFESSVSYFARMRRMDVRPDRLTAPFVLKSTAAGLLVKSLGLALHADVMKLGLEFDYFVRVSLVDMHAKLGFFDLALQLFDDTPEGHKQSSVLLWNVLINACCRAGDMKRAGELFEAMPERSVASWNSLINGFVRNGDMEGAASLFDGMPEKNVVSWTTMVSGFLQNGDNQRTLLTFNEMLDLGVRPNDFTIVSALCACARMGALKAGVQIHNYVLQNGFRLNKAIGTALIDMYSKCGKVEKAAKVFDHLKDRDLLTWSVMILGWAIHGHGKQALRTFEEMKARGVEPDEVTFLSVLMACSHSETVDQGLELFHSMRQDYSIEPTVKHYTCMVDLFGRAGRLEEAFRFAETMPAHPDLVIWNTLFLACKAQKNIELARLVLEKLRQLKSKHSDSYNFRFNTNVLETRRSHQSSGGQSSVQWDMSTPTRSSPSSAGPGLMNYISPVAPPGSQHHVEARGWKNAWEVRTPVKNSTVRKSHGWSCIEVGGHVHNFETGDQSHHRSQEIYAKVEEMATCASEEAHKPDIQWVLSNIEEEEKEQAYGVHSEKLALALGLLSTPEGEAIRIAKNLRVCDDCHSVMKFASRMYKRDIFLRDDKFFHHFNNGVCSCRDYW